MFQKSLQILIASALLTLAAIVGYSALRLHGPEDTLAEARTNFAAGNYGDVIFDLNLAEHGASFSDSPELTWQLWQLRYEAQAQLDNPEGALIDLRRLLSSDAGSNEALRLDEIRLLARAGNGEQALLRGRAFLEDDPENGRALELAGEACQTIYQPKLRDLQVRMERDLGRARRAAARKALLAYLYRPDGDPEVARSINTIEAMFATEPRLVATWVDVRAQARELRARIQEGLGYFQHSLDLGGEPVAAFRAVATAFEQSGRIDDLLMACEIQRRIFDHAYVDESGALAAWTRLNLGLPEAGIATVDRWLSDTDVEQQALDGALGPASEQLALARALATWQTKDTAQLWSTVKLVNKLRDYDVDIRGAQWLINAVRLTITEQHDPLLRERNLRFLLNVALSQPAPLDRPDLVAELEPLMLSSMIERTAPDAEILANLLAWREGRPESVEPYIRTARYLQSHGRTAAALAAIADAAEVAPEDPRLLPLRLEISTQHYENTTQNGLSLLTQCLEAQETLPATEDPIGFLLCAQTALTHSGQAPAQVAMNCARAAIGAFPTANLPRQLELSAQLAMGRFAEAAATADLTVRAISPNAETLRLAILAKRSAGESLREIAQLAIERVSGSPELQVELLRIALEDAPTTALQFVTPAMTSAEASVEARALAIHALIEDGQLDEARTQLTAAGRQVDGADQAVMLAAFSRWLVAQSDTTADEALCGEATALRDLLNIAAGPQTPLLAALPALASTHPKTAASLIERALTVADPTERNGGHYALAGDLSLANADLVRAETHWLAALGFADGAFVAERLARLVLLQGDEARAAKIYRLVDQPTDPALAARMGRLTEAAAVLQKQLLQDPTDLLVQATLATFGQPTLLDWTAATTEDAKARRLELLSGLHVSHLAPLTLPRARELSRNDEARQTTSLLLARASCDAGLEDEAAALHTQLCEAGASPPVTLREVAQAGQNARYAPSPIVDAKLIEGVTNNKFASSKMTFAYATERIVRGFQAAGFQEVAEKALLTQWLTAPKLHPWTDADLNLITGKLPAMQACFVIDQIMRGPHARAPEPLIEAFYERAAAAIANAPNNCKALYAMANGQLERHGPAGAIVHFLIKHKRENERLDEVELLSGHLARIATGRDSRALLDESVERLVATRGLTETVERVDELIDAYPSAIAMWSLRSRLLTKTESDASVLEGMRHVLSHAADPDAELSFFGLAAAAHAVTDADIARLKELPAEIRATPRGRYVEALFALRRGDAGAAAELFADAEPQSDGRHLFLWALAQLMCGEGAPTERATELLMQLERDYPNSSLTRNAGSFIRQLSPR